LRSGVRLKIDEVSIEGDPVDAAIASPRCSNTAGCSRYKTGSSGFTVENAGRGYVQVGMIFIYPTADHGNSSTLTTLSPGNLGKSLSGPNLIKPARRQKLLGPEGACAAGTTAASSTTSSTAAAGGKAKGKSRAGEQPGFFEANSSICHQAFPTVMFREED
jgi:hypothetical protein